MQEFLVNLDLKWLYFVNHTLSNHFFDWLMPILRNKLTWLPLYLLVIYLITKKYGYKSVWVIGFAVVTVVLCDQISSAWIKPYFERLRPCNNPEISQWINLPIGKGHGWSFISSHATNHFGLATYFSMVLIGYKKQYKIYIPFMLWAFSIAFAQVYLAYHYPSDVILGALLGMAIGYGMARLNCLVLCLRSDNTV